LATSKEVSRSPLTCCRAHGLDAAELMFGTFLKYQYQRTYDAILAAPGDTPTPEGLARGSGP
jgi:hypothetical protein